PACLCQVAVPDLCLRLVDADVNPVFLKNLFSKKKSSGGEDMVKSVFAMKTGGVFLPLLKPSRYKGAHGARLAITRTVRVRFWGVKRTSGGDPSMSAYDPKRTSAC